MGTDGERESRKLTRPDDDDDDIYIYIYVNRI